MVRSNAALAEPLTSSGRSSLEAEWARLNARLEELLYSAQLNSNALADTDSASVMMSEQWRLQDRLHQISGILQRAKRAILPAGNGEDVRFGDTVELQNGKALRTIRLVSSAEADPLNNCISERSPLGQALLGKKIGETASITTPQGKIVTYAIQSIEPGE